MVLGFGTGLFYTGTKQNEKWKSYLKDLEPDCFTQVQSYNIHIFLSIIDLEPCYL